MKTKLLYQVDAFTAEPFKGNPAGVMVVTDDITTERMQQLAMEMNLSETAFIFPQHDNLFQIRYFTPTKEVDLCGHATLASAHILYETGRVAPDEQIQFKAKGADLAVSKSDGWLAMNFPRYPLTPRASHPDFTALVGFEPVELYDSSYNWVIAVANSEEDVRNASPVFSALTETGLGHLMITAPASIPGYDFVLRCFVPWAGIDEDPVTGSAHCALNPLWTEKLGKKQLTSLQVSKRTGTLKTELSEDRVIIKGQAVTVLNIELRINS
ncbi:PhzF family phenazine biosynthesis protein [Paludibacter sp.]|uniref:PhzF family phenazine biosynthesis protein n=1 Tax=Paludibacter sp. TaxID=1898105 RepID=UPI00135504D1|nr:PhzF family phenazine biosynthesis protein [Paludibacter sp.]MTK54035.1 PhzF family phenazine biosynthesis protein [Paludibacter sp.]